VLFDSALQLFGGPVGNFFSGGGGGKRDFSGPRTFSDVGGNSRNAEGIVDMNGRYGDDVRVSNDVRLDIDFGDLSSAFQQPNLINYRGFNTSQFNIRPIGNNSPDPVFRTY